MTIAILSAMAEENASLMAHMTDVQITEAGQRTYYQGQLWGQSVVVVFSHWGKVAAASTVTYLISCLGVDEVIFTGVAGGMDRRLKVGDIVVADKLYQHDMDVRPILPRHEIPLLGKAAMDSDDARRPALVHAAQDFVNQDLNKLLSSELIDEFNLRHPDVITADIASGDQFISSNEAVQDLRDRLPSVACVEMEGAAVAQVCSEFGIPFSVVRTISDSADHSAHIDFPKFIQEVAQVYSLGIVRNLLSKM